MVRALILKAALCVAFFVSATGEAQERGRITDGTTKATSQIQWSAPSGHGDRKLRTWGTLSHWSYDDPIVYPGQPGASHLHIFGGNCSTDAFSTLATLLAAGCSTMESGLTISSAWWFPSLFLEDGTVVLPYEAGLYYRNPQSRDFYPDPTPPEAVAPLPNGLQMIARGSGWKWAPDGSLRIALDFPECGAVYADGSPVLSGWNMPQPGPEAHMRPIEGPGGQKACPATHPRRYVGVTLTLKFRGVRKGSDWYVASDPMLGTKNGATMHADYIAVWPEGMDFVMDGITTGRTGQFTNPGRGGARAIFPERFDLEGERVYKNGVSLLDPFRLGKLPVTLAKHDHHEPDPEPDPSPAPGPEPVEGPESGPVEGERLMWCRPAD